jgi:tetratricopeptide (TPR) repeat protein
MVVNHNYLRGLWDQAIIGDESNLAQAMRAIRAYLSIVPRDPMGLLQLARLLTISCRFDEATATMESLSPWEDEIGKLPYLTAWIELLSTCGKHDAAEPWCRKLIAHSPRDEEAICRLGACFESQGRLEDAESTFRQACQLDSESGFAFFRLGLVLRARELYKPAEESLAIAVAREPKNRDFRDALDDVQAVLRGV